MTAKRRGRRGGALPPAVLLLFLLIVHCTGPRLTKALPVTHDATLPNGRSLSSHDVGALEDGGASPADSRTLIAPAPSGGAGMSLPHPPGLKVYEHSKEIATATGASFLQVGSTGALATRTDASSRAFAKYISDHPPMDRCQICVYVLERIKQGYQYLLPSICLEVYSKQYTGQGEIPYQICHHVLYSLNVWGNNVRHWFQFGCYKSESYGAMEVLRPCPSHIICAQLGDMKKIAFCDNVKQDKLDPGK